MAEGKFNPLALFERLGTRDVRNPAVGTDQERIKRDEERRARPGQLRARKRARKRKVDQLFS